MKKQPNPIDKHVGSRVRMRRMMLSMSQEKLADGLDLTFQQVQKYEKGTNRIGASRMQQIANILQVPVSFFFEGAPGQSPSIAPDSNVVDVASFTDFMTKPYAAELVRHYMAIDHNVDRRKLVDLAELIAMVRRVPTARAKTEA